MTSRVDVCLLFKIQFLIFQLVKKSQIFVIFAQKIIFFILVDFEKYEIHPRKSPKNGRNDAHGLNFRKLFNFGSFDHFKNFLILNF